MEKVYVYNHKTKLIKATLDVRCFMIGANERGAYLKRLHEKRYWLMCCCIKPYAIMYPRLQGEQYQLVNDPVKGNHHEQCPLYTQVSGRRSPKRTIKDVLFEQPTSFTPVKIGKLRAPLSTQKVSHTPRSLRLQVKQENTIHTLMLFALMQAKLDYLQTTKNYNLKDIYKTATFKIPVCRSKGERAVLSVGDLTFFNPDIERVDWKSIIQRKVKYFTERVPPQAYIVQAVEWANYDREAEVLTTYHDGREVTYSCSRVTHHYERTRGPRIVFIVYVLLESWVVVTIYTHPIIAVGIPVLIDSNIERNFGQLFLKYKDPNLKLYKYYRGMMDKGILLLPDFKMINCTRGNYWAEIVEVMGVVNDSSYEDRKKYIVPAMAAKFGLPVRVVHPESLSKDLLKIMTSVRKGNN